MERAHRGDAEKRRCGGDGCRAGASRDGRLDGFGAPLGGGHPDRRVRAARGRTSRGDRVGGSRITRDMPGGYPGGDTGLSAPEIARKGSTFSVVEGTMPQYAPQLTSAIRAHLSGLITSSGLPETPESLEEMARVWFEKKAMFEGQVKSLRYAGAGALLRGGSPGSAPPDLVGLASQHGASKAGRRRPRDGVREHRAARRRPAPGKVRSGRAGLRPRPG